MARSTGSWLLRPFAVLMVVTMASHTGNPTSPSADPNLLVQLTDDHTEEVEQVNIFFNSVTANPVGGTPETANLELSDHAQDLLVLRDAVIPLTTAGS